MRAQKASFEYLEMKIDWLRITVMHAGAHFPPVNEIPFSAFTLNPPMYIVWQMMAIS